MSDIPKITPDNAAAPGTTPDSRDPATGQFTGIFNEEIFAQILERLSAGEPLAQICRSDGMPSAHTVRSWQVKREDVREAIAAAREAGEEVIASDCLAIADDGHNDWQEGKYGPMPNGEVVQRSKLRVWTRLQLLARWNPKKWAERQSHQMLDEHGQPAKAGVMVFVDGVKGADGE